jgi:quercetin dioxygenase-like cupin family protein
MKGFIPSQNVAQVEMLSGIHRRTMAITDAMMLCEILIERNAIVPDHSHENEQVGYVVYGKLELTIDGETRICDPGDSYAIPGGIVHGAKAIVDTVVIDVFSPPREDYR